MACLHLPPSSLPKIQHRPAQCYQVHLSTPLPPPCTAPLPCGPARPCIGPGPRAGATRPAPLPPSAQPGRPPRGAGVQEVGPGEGDRGGGRGRGQGKQGWRRGRVQGGCSVKLPPHIPPPPSPLFSLSGSTPLLVFSCPTCWPPSATLRPLTTWPPFLRWTPLGPLPPRPRSRRPRRRPLGRCSWNSRRGRCTPACTMQPLAGAGVSPLPPPLLLSQGKGSLLLHLPLLPAAVVVRTLTAMPAAAVLACC